MINGFYSIGEICELLQTEQYTLRYMIKSLDMKIERDEMNNRIFSESDLGTLRIVMDLKNNKGLNIKAIKKILDDSKEVEEETAAEGQELIVPSDNKSMEQLLQLLSDRMTADLCLKLEEKFEDIEEKIDKLLDHASGTEEVIHDTEEEHYRMIDERLLQLRNEMKVISINMKPEKEKKGLFKRLLNKA